MNIYKEDFLKYERARYRGANMVDELSISANSELSLLKIETIKNNYDEFKKTLYDEEKDRYFVKGITPAFIWSR